MSPENAWQPGTEVARYTLLAKIAVGGMAEIWLARQAGPRGFEKVVVIKRILESYSTDPDFVEMFLDEARIAAQLNHPNIVQIYDLGEHGSAWYIAMEYLAGENLSAIMRATVKQNTTLPLRVAMKIIANACEGLAHAHTKTGPTGQPLHIVHRDVSPQNLHLTYDGQVKIVDFGIAKAANKGFHTTGGQIKGKFSYMAPEHAAGEDIDSRADVFALGVIAWEIATYTRAFRADDDMKVLKMVTSPEPLALAHTVNPEVPEALSAVLAKALEKDRELRYQDARAFQAGLEQWLQRNGPSPTSADIAATMTTLFGDRIKERTELIDSASRGELTPSGARKAMSRNTGSHPVVSMPPPTPPRDRRKLGFIGGALALVLVSLGAWALRPEPETRVDPTPHVKPVDVTPVDPKPAPGPPVLAVDTEPRGAVITVDGEVKGRSPLDVEGLAPGKHVIIGTLEGRVATKRELDLAGEGKQSTLLMLPPEPKVETPPPDKTAVPAARKGKLTLSTTPWTSVSVKGRSLGDTPLIDVPLPAGRHLLKLVNADKKIDRTIEVEIKAGATTTKKLAF